MGVVRVELGCGGGGCGGEEEQAVENVGVHHAIILCLVAALLLGLNMFWSSITSARPSLFLKYACCSLPREVKVLIVKAKQASSYIAKKLNNLHKKRHCSFSEVSLLAVQLGSFLAPASMGTY